MRSVAPLRRTFIAASVLALLVVTVPAPRAWADEKSTKKPSESIREALQGAKEAFWNGFDAVIIRPGVPSSPAPSNNLVPATSSLAPDRTPTATRPPSEPSPVLPLEQPPGRDPAPSASPSTRLATHTATSAIPTTPPATPSATQAVAKPEAEEPIAVRYWIELVQDDDPRTRKVTVDRTFYSEERIRIHFQSNRDAYIVLGQPKPGGTFNQLFPHAELGKVEPKVRAGETKVLPGERDWMRFDENAGIETVCAYLSTRRLPHPDVTDRLLAGTQPTEALEPVKVTTTRGMAKGLVVETERSYLEQVGTYVAQLEPGDMSFCFDLRHE